MAAKKAQKNNQINTTTIGLIGGGQLARMLAMSAHQMGLNVRVFSANRSDPAAQVCHQWSKGQLTRLSALEKFIDENQYVTFESEFLPKKILSALDKKKNLFPKAAIMIRLQDRLTQKKWMDDSALPTSPWIHPKAASEIVEFADQHGWPVVCKARYGGYDGYGTHIFKSSAEIQKSDLKWQDFIVEKFIPFKRELALLFACSAGHPPVCYPLVETKQKESRCFWVKGPTESKPADRLRNKVGKALKKLGYVGVFAVELFDCGDTVLINEIAPRVHNSAHYSQDALLESQFAAHLKCGLGKKVILPRQLSHGFAMVNVLGEASSLGSVPDIPSGHFHWYGKLENRKGRKMGHINCVDETPEKALKKALMLRKKVQV